MTEQETNKSASPQLCNRQTTFSSTTTTTEIMLKDQPTLPLVLSDNYESDT